ncbi:MAG: hypothetical protein NVS3B21_22180 [Acidimicrobiales bacterium]
MAPTLDERLCELAQATHKQLEPSSALLGRIRAATATRIRPLWARPPAIVAAAAVVAAVLGAPALLRSPSHRSVNAPAAGQSTAPQSTVTRQQFITEMNNGCRQYAERYGQTRVVFPTAQAYAAAAAALIPAAQGGVGGPVPPDAAPVVAAVNAELRDAVEWFQTAQARGLAGDVNGAKAAFDAGNADLNKVSTELAAYGATACAPHP